MLKPAHIEFVNYKDTFEVKSDADKASDRKWHSHMNIFITTDFLKGYDPSDGFRGHVNVVGAVNDRNEMILIESQNGKITRTFLGEFQKKGKGTMILSGTWKSSDNTLMKQFSGNKHTTDFDHPQAFLLISKNQ